MPARDTAAPHPVVADLYGQMHLPVICSPMFIVSNPALVLAQCTSGVMGAFPALNARPQSLLADWLAEVQTGLADYRRAHPHARVAPFAVNQIIHQSNDRLEQDWPNARAIACPTSSPVFVRLAIWSLASMPGAEGCFTTSPPSAMPRKRWKPAWTASSW